MAARVRQIQLWLVPDSPAGHARRPRVRLRPAGVRDDRAVERPTAVLRRSGRAVIRAGVAVVAVVRDADSQTEGAVSVLTAWPRRSRTRFLDFNRHGFVVAPADVDVCVPLFELAKVLIVADVLLELVGSGIRLTLTLRPVSRRRT